MPAATQPPRRGRRWILEWSLRLAERFATVALVAAALLALVDRGGPVDGVLLRPVLRSAPRVLTSVLPQAEVGVAYLVELAAAGGTPPYAWSVAAGGLPAGLLLDSDGTLSGLPATGGSYQLAVRVTDAAGLSAGATLSLTVVSAALPPERYAILTRRGLLLQSAAGSLARVARVRLPVAALAAARRGWWVLARGGEVLGVGGARPLGSLPAGSAAIGIAAATHGYLLATAGGEVVGYGGAGGQWRAPLPGRVEAVAIAAAAGGGCWLLGSNGEVFALGGAPEEGSPPAHRRYGRFVGIAADPTGDGYWLATAAGTVLSFGQALPQGAPAPHSTAPVVAIAAAPFGQGYWLLTVRGDVLAYGSAKVLDPPERLAAVAIAAARGSG